MSHELVGLVAICLGAYLGAFVQSFVVDLDCGRGPSAILTTTYQIKVRISWNFVTERVRQRSKTTPSIIVFERSVFIGQI